MLHSDRETGIGDISNGVRSLDRQGMRTRGDPFPINLRAVSAAAACDGYHIAIKQDLDPSHATAITYCHRESSITSQLGPIGNSKPIKDKICDGGAIPIILRGGP